MPTFRTALLISIVLVCLFFNSARGAETRPNVLLIIADDQSWCHTSFNGDPAVKTPNFDRIAREGTYFANAHTIAASCTPSRAALLTGRPIWQLEEGAMLWCTLPAKFPVYPDLLEQNGYFVGLTGKGWGPGDPKPGGRTRNPAGPTFADVDAFLAKVPADKPFCYWFGSRHPHRPYKSGAGQAAGVDPAKVRVPPMLPDVPEVRSDVATYLSEIETYDREVGRVLAAIAKAGRLDNTIIVITSDNGMPFPRGKATLNEFGTHMPLAIRWPGHVPAGKTVTDFVAHIDIAPTILEATGVALPDGMVGRSLLSLASAERPDPKRDRVYLGNERHAYDVRTGNVGYPRRAVRTADYLYIHNYEPSRWPAGDPDKFGDVDPAGGGKGDSLSKDFLLAHRDEETYKPFYEAAFAKKPAEELYDLRSDPGEMTNVAADPRYSKIKSDLRADLDRHLAATKDPRANADQPAPFDEYPRHGGRGGPQRRAE